MNLTRNAVIATIASALLVLATGCGGGGHTSSPPPKKAREYRVGPEDVLEVVVWKEPGLSATIPVRPDGKINVPLAGEVKAAGRTTREIEGDLKAEYAKTINDPTVSVILREINSARIFVVGEVARPGVYPMRGTMNVLQALAIAGGLTEFADDDEIVVLRRDDEGKQHRLAFSYGSAVSNGRAFDLEPGDTVIVP